MSSGDTPSSSPPAGWYPDPLDPTFERLWDGEQWSERTRSGAQDSVLITPPVRSEAAPAPDHGAPTTPDRRPPGKGMSTGSVVGIGCGLLALLSLGGCVVLVGVVPLMAVRSEEGFVAEEVEIAVPAPQPTRGPVPIGPEPLEDFPVTTAGPGAAAFGSSVEMVAVLGSGDAAAFDVVVEEPVDVTELVVAAGGRDADLDDGQVLVGVAATIVMRESIVDLFTQPGLLQWTIIGAATGDVHPPVLGGAAGCDLIDTDLTIIDEFAIGDEQRGIVCFRIPVEDFEDPATQVLLEIEGGAPITWTR